MERRGTMWWSAGLASLIVAGIVALAGLSSDSSDPRDALPKAIDPEVPYVPTPDDVVAEMLEMASVGKDDVVYDLGCGDGRIVIAAAKRYGARGVGIDIDPRRIEESNANALAAGVSDRVRFIRGDFFATDLHEATVVTLYLLPWTNERLRPKLLQELAPGARVVSHNYGIGDWEPVEQKQIGDHLLFLWVVRDKRLS